MEAYIWFICNQKLCIPSLYIDPSIFDWFNQMLVDKKYSKLVEDVWDIKIKNVEFHEIDVKLIQFHSKYRMDNENDDERNTLFSDLKLFLQEILIETKFCLPWLPFTNLYCSLDEYECRLADLKQCGLLDAVIEVKDYHLNWIEQRPVKLFKFERGAFNSYKEIQSKSIYKINGAPFITCAYPWHQSWYINYFSYDTDFLAIYICVVEWKRMDLLKDFNIFDILSLDQALCDSNDCLNAYVKRLFTREFKFIINLHATNKFEQFDLERYLYDKKRYVSVQIDIYLYFLYSYGKHLKFINWSDKDITNLTDISFNFIMILRNMFPNVNIQKNKFITLKSNTVLSYRIVKSLKKSKYGNIILDISNYKLFSPEMLNELLRIKQIIRIEINVDVVNNFEKEPPDNVGVDVVHFKTIYLYSKTGGNVRNIESILKYLQKLQVTRLIKILCVIINNCVIDNYEIFKEFNLHSIEFQNMDINLTDLRTFCSQQQNIKILGFSDCAHFGDHHLITLLECDHFIIKRIFIEGNHSVTLNFYFRYAEQQIISKKITHFKFGHSVPVINMISYGTFQNLTFVRNEVSGKIEMQNSFNEILDIFDLFYDSDDTDRDMYDFYT